LRQQLQYDMATKRARSIAAAIIFLNAMMCLLVTSKVRQRLTGPDHAPLGEC
jgi:hypothetical protein